MALQVQAGQDEERVFHRHILHRAVRNAFPYRIHKGAAGGLRGDNGPEHGTAAEHPVHNRRNMSSGIQPGQEPAGYDRAAGEAET